MTDEEIEIPDPLGSQAEEIKKRRTRTKKAPTEADETSSTEEETSSDDQPTVVAKFDFPVEDATISAEPQVVDVEPPEVVEEVEYKPVEEAPPPVVEISKPVEINPGGWQEVRSSAVEIKQEDSVSEPFVFEAPPSSYTPAPPKKNNNVWWIVGSIVLLLFLCCCCSILAFFWVAGDEIMRELSSLHLIPAISRLMI